MVVPYRDPVARPLPPHRLRHRRVGPGLHDHVARARLRLPGRDHLRRRRPARQPRRAVRDQERDLHPRGGRRRAVEARRREGRRRGPPLAAAGRVSFHVTVANYEYLVYWRFYQDGTIECEVRATGIMVTSAFEGDPAAVRHGGRPPHLRADPPALHGRAAGHGGRRAGEHRRRDDTEALPVSERNPYGLALIQRVRRRSPTEGGQDSDWETQRGWKVTNARADQRLGRTDGLQARRRARRSRRWPGRSRRW